MGPTKERGAFCKTCSRDTFNCPGHMGHIELPLPVVNAVFRKELLKFLRSACMICYRLQMPDLSKYLVITQMKLLDLGLGAAAADAEQVVANIDPDLKGNEAVGLWAKEQLDQYMRKVLEAHLDEATPGSLQLFETMRRHFVDTAFHQSVSKKKNCVLCGEPLKKFYVFQCQFLSSVSKVSVAKKFSGSGNTQEPMNVTSPAKKTKGTAPTKASTLRNHMRNLWANESEFLVTVCPALKRPDMMYPTDIFFIDTVPVSPPNCRPLLKTAQGDICEHPSTAQLKAILQDTIILNNVVRAMQDGEDALLEEGKALVKQMKGSSLLDKLNNCWDELQANVDHLFDKDVNKVTNSAAALGVRQILEKKEGLFRMNMMGKRVNFAARSVITPDPNLDIDEIGIPEAFAKRLTYPTPVSPGNVQEMRKLVLNGPDIYPGAVMIQSEEGNVTNLRKESQRVAMANRLLTPSGFGKKSFGGCKIVHRHLQNGDLLLLNRQPTLHRPSIMAHRARVLKGEKTIRLHYANCSSYNADFDGDEMNAHFPQNEVARSEAANLVNVCHQYLVPKNGTPLSGLIQDHVISGVKLTMRDRFFTREEYHQLVFQGLSSVSGAIQLLLPSIIKPVPMWSGKQVISTVLLNVLPKNKPPLTIESMAKIGVKAWGSHTRPCYYGGTPLENIDMTEAEVIIHQGQLLCGVLDKKHYGATPYGLVHCVYELYGGLYSARLLSAFSKLFMAFLQVEGFTLGVADILVFKKADQKRANFILQARKIGNQIVKEALELDPEASEEIIQHEMNEAFSSDPAKFRTTLDRKYKQALDQYTNDINRVCLPAGLIRKFPDNNLQLMVQSGAKGSTVNTMQISCLLGQIELEGKRPPLMISGKSLPSFPPFDTSPRAGGFIDGRFVSGIRPQEFFFHCMAGREGLIDTAVKTSRSGYLQRCLVKHLESLVVAYDQTVRNSDGSVVQFYYGEDGMDVSKVQFLKAEAIHVLTDNAKILISDAKAMVASKPKDEVLDAKKKLDRWRKKYEGSKRQQAFVQFSTEVAKRFAEFSSLRSSDTGRAEKYDEIIKAWRELHPKTLKRFLRTHTPCPDPVSSQFQMNRDFGVVSEKLENLIKSKVGDCEELKNLLYFKSITSQSPPGESVGVLAAQSVGEPSTQMTLNTFHFAGRGDMNVTLGIPRLREILMTASKFISTPSMDIPFLPHVSEKKAEKLRLRFTRVTLSDVLHNISVTERVDVGMTRQFTYKIRFNFLPSRCYKRKFPVKPSNIIKYMELQFFNKLEAVMKKSMKIRTNDVISTQNDKDGRKWGRGSNDNDDDEISPAEKPSHMGTDGENHMSSDEEAEGDDEDATMARNRSRHTENREYEDPEEGEEERESDAENAEEEMVDDPDEAKNAAPEDFIPDNVEQLMKDPAFHDFSMRVMQVKSSTSFVQSYEYDLENELWCEVILGVSLNMRKVDMSTLLRDTAKKSVIWQIDRIKKAFTYRNSNQELMLKVDGINIAEMCKHYKLLDLNRLYTNDIHAMASIYGIEAASRVLVKEVQDVFQVYGITVDPRHLLLIADYMTFTGTYIGLNRGGIQCSSSPLQQITFETSLFFLRQAIFLSKKDHLKSPSSCLIAGQPCKIGTGMFDLKLRII